MGPLWSPCNCYGKGGHGGNGGEQKIQDITVTPGENISITVGGVGYGGGGGAAGCALRNCHLYGGSGAKGYCKITYTANKYQHPDGTIYYEQP